MKILVTSDWQADYENLDLCKHAAKEVSRTCSQHGIEVLVLAGDLKHVYNPVDVRVVNFWLRTIARWRKQGLVVVVCLGNHDRVGMHVDKQNWLPVLRKAGALAYDEPTYIDIRDRRVLAILPFRNSPQLLRTEARELARNPAAANCVLIFHSELRGAKYNVFTRADDAAICVDDLCAGRYLYCIGGHYHLQQKVERNVWYCGSPFATDWGEANQKKGYLVVDLDEKSVTRVRSKIPGWYDPSWPGFEESKPEDWNGSHIRVKVPVEGIHQIREKLEEAETAARKNFEGAITHVVPEFKEAGRSSKKIRATYPDEKKIRLYVAETIPDELRVYEKKIQKFLIDQLEQAGGLQRENGELTFKGFTAENFLSYEKLKFDFEPGLCVVSGLNKDWGGRSNGSGKTSFLQPVAVAHSGQTFKDQKHDHWIRRGADKKLNSYVKIWFLDSQGRACSILRSRQPKDLVLKVSGEIIESGNRPENTQKLIEQITGYTWETLSNAIYVDQAKSHLMLTGTEAERKGFLAKIQNLERFERAQKSVNSQKQDFDERYTLISASLGALTNERNSLIDTISQTKKIMALNGSIAEIYRRKKGLYRQKNAELKEWQEKASLKLEGIRQQMSDNRKQQIQSERKLAVSESQLEELRTRLAKYRNLEGTCPRCGQEVSADYIQKQIGPTKAEIEALSSQIKTDRSVAQDSVAERDRLLTLQAKWERNTALEDEVGSASLEYESARLKMEQHERNEKVLSVMRDKLRGLKEKITQLEGKKKKIGKWLSVLKYAMIVFRRDGLPAYLNAQICPELNRAAEEYSELFAQSEIHVRFEVDTEGRLDVSVVNAHGGENVEDQSEGEMKMASLITSFAVRSVAPKTNILILDEPGDGLDSTSARAFARGLKKVVSRFGTILLTTHNPAILSELSDARSVSVVKEDGVSRVV